MIPFCIPKDINNKLKKAVDSGQLKLDELFKKSSEEVDNYIKPYVGDKYSKEISDRFTRHFETELTTEQVDQIFRGFTKIDDLKAKQGFATKAGEIKEWARLRADLDEFMSNIVNPKNTLGLQATVKKSILDQLQKIKDQETLFDKILKGGETALNVLTAPVYKSIKASIDASFALRQGFKILTKSPTAYSNNIKRAFEIFKNIGSQKEMNAIAKEFKATLLSQKNYSRLVEEGKLAVGVIEDWFPTSVAEKIKGLGNLFKSSNEAFTIFSQGARFDIANNLMERYTTKFARELTKDEVKSIATIANSITGRGNLGRLESVSGALNKLLFSARYIKSQLDTFTLPFSQKLEPFARNEIRKHSLTTLGTIGSLMATASLFGEVEFDPLSTKFGKLRVGNTNNYIDLTAGLGGYITLAARQAKGESKTASGKIIKLNTGEYGSKTRGDVLADWATNKLAPAPAVFDSVFLKGEMYGGEKPNIENVARSLIAPISADNIYDYLTKEDLATALLISIADTSGIGVTQYK